MGRRLECCGCSLRRDRWRRSGGGGMERRRGVTATLHIYEGLASRDAKIGLEWMTPPSSSSP